MKTLLISTKIFERRFIETANKNKHLLIFSEHRLTNHSDFITRCCDTPCSNSDVLTLYFSLNANTKHLIDNECIARMKPGVMIVYISQGNLIATKTVIENLKNRKNGYFDLDVYEEEGLFYRVDSEDILLDNEIARLMAINSVLMEHHQAYPTETVLSNLVQNKIFDPVPNNIHAIIN